MIYDISIRMCKSKNIWVRACVCVCPLIVWYETMRVEGVDETDIHYYNYLINNE